MLSQVILCPYLLFFRTVSGLHLHLQGNGLTNTLPLGQAVLVWEERADMYKCLFLHTCTDRNPQRKRDLDNLTDSQRSEPKSTHSNI